MNEIIREHFTQLPSTNVYVKEKGFTQDCIVTADCQSGGMGTKGRSFSSACGGVYLTKLTHHTDLPAKCAFKVMANAAVAVCETLAFYRLKPLIKWPNDVFVRDKKICGILIENTFSGGKIARSIVGIGLNVCNELPEELEEIATSMRLQGVEVGVAQVRERLIENLKRDFPMQTYLSYLGYLGKEVTLIFGDERVPATLLSVDDEGGLWVKTATGEQRVTAAEVSIRL